MRFLRVMRVLRGSLRNRPYTYIFEALVLDIISAYSQELEGICLFTLEGHTRPVTALAVMLDGKLASGSHDKTIRVWEGGTCLMELKGHTGL
jgi:WD40 repeat protein